MDNNKVISPPPPPHEVWEYMMKDLPDIKNSIFPLWRELLSIKVTWYEVVRQKALAEIENRYMNCMSKMIDAKEKVNILEKFISTDDPEAEKKIGILLSVGYLREMAKHESNVTQIMRDFSEEFRGKKAEADYKRALVISVIAIFIAIIAVVISLI